MPLLPPKRPQVTAIQEIDHNEFCRRLQDWYDLLHVQHNRAAPRGGVPVGGGDWMDTFFRMEAIRGMQTALRAGKSFEEATQFGKDCSTIAVGLWNKKREFQVHRWEQTAWDYLDTVIRSIRRWSNDS